MAGERGGKRKRDRGRDVLFLSPLSEMSQIPVTNAISFQSTLIKQLCVTSQIV